MTILFFLLYSVPVSSLAPQNKADEKQGVWLHQPCGEQTWRHLVVILSVESSAHSPTPRVPHCPDTAQVHCSWEAGPGPPTAALTLPHKPLLGLDARPQHVLPLDHIWMLLDKLQVIRQ